MNIPRIFTAALLLLMMSLVLPDSAYSQTRYRELVRRNKVYVKRSNSQPYTGTVVDYHRNGNIKVRGTFTDGLMEGEWEYFHESGALWGKGFFISGNGDNPSPVSGIPVDGRNGVWCFYDEFGNLTSEYHYERGKQTGEQKEWYPDSTLKSLNDLDTGRQQVWYSNGQIRSDDDPRNDNFREWYRNGNQKIENHTVDGSIREWFENGDLKKKGQIRDEMKEGEWIYYRSGQLMEKKVIYEQDVKLAELVVDVDDPSLSIWKEFYPNGRVRENGAYVNGKKHGAWTQYYLNGRIRERGDYDSDRRNGIWKTFNEKNVTVREIEYDSGKRQGIYIVRDDSGETVIQGKYSDDQKSGLWIYRFENGDMKSGHFHNDRKIGPWEFKYADGETFSIVFMDDMPSHSEPF